MTSLKISEENFSAWSTATDEAGQALTALGAAPSGDYGDANGQIDAEHSVWEGRTVTTYGELDLLKAAIERVKENMSEADQAGG